MEACTEEDVQRMLPLVSAQRRKQALGYKHLFGRFCCLKSWLMLKELMDNGQGTMDHWHYNEHGKPFIAGGPCFSISHCKAGIAVAVDGQSVGMDIESIRRADEDLIVRTMNEEEREIILAESGEERNRLFTRLWTQKEAVVKALGTGILSFEQLQSVLGNLPAGVRIETNEKENYIYSIAYKQN